MNVSRLAVLLVTSFFLVLQPKASAKQQARVASEYQALSSAISLRCSFPSFATVDWDGDEPKLRIDKNQDFAFQIDGIDHVKGTARLIGNAGADDLVAIRGMDSVSFVERVPAGTLNVTTVFAWRDKQGRFKAVTSRHTAIGVLAADLSVGGPAPSQNVSFRQARLTSVL